MLTSLHLSRVIRLSSSNSIPPLVHIVLSSPKNMMNSPRKFILMKLWIMKSLLWILKRTNKLLLNLESPVSQLLWSLFQVILFFMMDQEHTSQFLTLSRLLKIVNQSQLAQSLKFHLHQLSFMIQLKQPQSNSYLLFSQDIQFIISEKENHWKLFWEKKLNKLTMVSSFLNKFLNGFSKKLTQFLLTYSTQTFKTN